MDISYSDILPRWIKTTRKCQQLDSSGNRCNLTAAIESGVHEDPQHFGRWLAAEFCINHAEAPDLRHSAPKRRRAKR